MFGFVFGTACLIGLVGMARHGGHHHWGHGCGHGGNRRSRTRSRYEDRGDVMRRVFGEVFKRRLDIDEEQEGIVDHALKDARDAMEELRDEFKDTRGSVADAFKGEEVDDGALAAAFARHDDAIAKARRDLVSAMKQIHVVLDDKQRERAADWLAAGPEKWKDA